MASERRSISADDLHDLYLRLQGSPAANGLLDAETTFQQRDYAKTIEQVQAVRELYYRSHRRTLRKDPEPPDGKKPSKNRLALNLQEKQAKIRDNLEFFDQTLAALQRKVDWKLSAPAEPQRGSKATDVVGQDDELPALFRSEYEAAKDQPSQLTIIRRYFEVKKVASDRDIVPKTLCYLLTKQGAFLIRCSVDPSAPHTVSLTDSLTGRPLRSITTEKLLQLGNKRSLVRLVPLDQGKANAITGSPKGRPTSPIEKTPKTKESSENRAERVLDVGAFSQLLDAAQRSGIVPNADVIAYVRDREFRKGNYRKGLQDIQSLYSKFTLQASQREQRLRREYVDIAGGKIKMSARELQQKKARDIAETQKVERANKKFVRVIEGLRILQKTQAE